MGYTTIEVKTNFWPDDTDDTLHFPTTATFMEIMEAVWEAWGIQHWDDLLIEPVYIRTKNLQDDWAYREDDFTNFLKITLTNKKDPLECNSLSTSATRTAPALTS